VEEKLGARSEHPYVYLDGIVFNPLAPEIGLFIPARRNTGRDQAFGFRAKNWANPSTA
jgi:hypothetical protein